MHEITLIKASQPLWPCKQGFPSLMNMGEGGESTSAHVLDPNFLDTFINKTENQINYLDTSLAMTDFVAGNEISR